MVELNAIVSTDLLRVMILVANRELLGDDITLMC